MLPSLVHAKQVQGTRLQFSQADTLDDELNTTGGRLA